MSADLSLLSGYPEDVAAKVQTLIEQNKLEPYLAARYPEGHKITTNALLYDYVQEIKRTYMKKSPPVHKVFFDDRMGPMQNALGLHTFASRVQGKNLKSKSEIKIAGLFKEAPAAFLGMVVVHELAHLKEKDHNKNFYRLCGHIIPEYHQVEFDVILYLIHWESNFAASKRTRPPG